MDIVIVQNADQAHYFLNLENQKNKMKQKISGYQLKKKWWEDYGKGKPNDCYKSYCVGYRRALKDIETQKSDYDVCECGHYRKEHNDGIGTCGYNANVTVDRKGNIVRKDCYCKKFVEDK